MPFRPTTMALAVNYAVTIIGMEYRQRMGTLTAQ